MRAVLRLLLAFATSATLASPSHAQRKFEGTLTYDIDIGGRQMIVVLSARGNKARQDVDMPGTSVVSKGTYQLVDYDKDNVITVVPAMKRFMVMDLKPLRDASGETRARRDSTRERMLGAMTATGRRESVAGVECEVYTNTELPGDEWCITSALGYFRAFEGPRGASPMSPGAAVSPLMRTFKDGAVVLRLRMTGPDGNEVKMVATKIDRSPPPPKTFAIPAGFEEMQNPMVPRQ